MELIGPGKLCFRFRSCNLAGIAFCHDLDILVVEFVVRLSVLVQPRSVSVMVSPVTPSILSTSSAHSLTLMTI